MSTEETKRGAAGEAERGLYGKYKVTRLNDPTEKHADCEFFVLDWQHDPFAIPAACAYADACEAKFPELARDLRRNADTYARYHELAPSVPPRGMAACKPWCGMQCSHNADDAEIRGQCWGLGTGKDFCSEACKDARRPLNRAPAPTGTPAGTGWEDAGAAGFCTNANCKVRTPHPGACREWCGRRSKHPGVSGCNELGACGGTCRGIGSVCWCSDACMLECRPIHPVAAVEVESAASPPVEEGGLLTFAEAMIAVAAGKDVEWRQLGRDTWMRFERVNPIGFEVVAIWATHSYRLAPAPRLSRVVELAREWAPRVTDWNTGERMLTELLGGAVREVLDRARAIWPAYWTNTNAKVDEQLRAEYLGPSTTDRRDDGR